MSNSTPNLGIAHIATNQSQKEVTANTAFDEFDTAMTQQTTINVFGSADITPSSATLLLGFSFTITGTLTASVNLIVPAVMKFYRFHHNALHPSIGDYTITVKVSGQTGIVLQPGDRRLLYCNGTDIVEGDSTVNVVEKLALDERTTTTEVINDSDRAGFITFNNGSAVAASIAQAGFGGNFAKGWWCKLYNKGAGTVTITPTGSTVNGGTTITLAQYASALLWSDGTNFFV
jgi:hypothetical protein